MEPGPDRFDAARWAKDVGRAGRLLADGFRLMVGIPSYDAYLSHMKATHPDRKVMDYETFFQERQQARYRCGGGRCC